MSRCRKKAPVVVAPVVVTSCSPFRSIVGLIVVLIVIQFLCGIFNGGCGNYYDDEVVIEQ